MPIGIKSLLAFFSCFFKRNCLSRLFNLDLYYNYPYYISYMTHSFMVKHSLKKFFFFFESFIPGVAVCYQQLRITIDVIRTCKCFGIKVRTFLETLINFDFKFWSQSTARRRQQAEYKWTPHTVHNWRYDIYWGLVVYFQKETSNNKLPYTSNLV